MDDKVFIFVILGGLFGTVYQGWIGVLGWIAFLFIAGYRYYEVYTGEKRLNDN